MTVTAQTPVAEFVFNGPGEYSFSFETDDATDIHVYHIDATGVESELIYTTDFTVTLNTLTIGGHVDVTVATYGAGTLKISRELPLSQEMDLVAAGRFDPETLERAIDRTVMILQQINLLATSQVVASNWNGTWITAHSYDINAMVVAPNGNWYIALLEHTSGVFATDLAAGKWLLLLDIAYLESLTSASAASALAAGTSETNAAASEYSANASMASALISENHAANCAAAAYDSETSAAQSAVDAAASAETAEDFAASVDNTTYGIAWDGETNRAPSQNAAYDILVTLATILGTVAKTSATGSALLPIGTTGQRDGSPTTGAIRFNSTETEFEGYDGSEWAGIGGGGGGLEWSVETTNKDTVANLGYLMDTSGAAKTVTLHATPVVGDTIAVGDYARTFGTNACTIARNSMLIDGVAANKLLKQTGEYLTLVYSGATKGWVTVQTVHKHPIAVSGLNVEGGIVGGDVTTSGTGNHVLTVTKCSCYASDGVTPMATTADTVMTALAATVNQDFYTFIVRLVADGSFTMKAYTTYAGPSSDALVDKWRWISYAKNDGSGVTMPYIQTAGRIDWITQTSRPILTATTTTSLAPYSVSTVLPNTLLKAFGITTPNSRTLTVSYDGTTTALASTPAGAIVNTFLEILPVASVYLMTSTDSQVVTISHATLRR